jgi:hypothetical protein
LNNLEVLLTDLSRVGYSNTYKACRKGLAGIGIDARHNRSIDEAPNNEKAGRLLISSGPFGSRKQARPCHTRRGFTAAKRRIHNLSQVSPASASARLDPKLIKATKSSCIANAQL